MTTICSVKFNGKTAIAGDGQVTLGEKVIAKASAKKIRRIYHDRVVIGFAGGVADAVSLQEMLEGKLEAYSGDLRRAAVEMAQAWRKDPTLQKLNAMLIAFNEKDLLLISGNGEVLEPNENVVFDAILRQRASLRQGTHAVKNRSAVSGGGKKPWRQKGTGRARQGSIRSPQFRGGGIVFGPTPRSYKYSLPRKVRQLAIKSALSQKVLDNSFVVVDALNFDAPKTKEFADVMGNLNVAEKTLVVVTDDDKNAALSARNLANATVVTPAGVNILNVVDNQKIVITKSALSQVEEVLA